MTTATQTENFTPHNRLAIVSTIDELIQQKRAPFEQRRQHLLDVDAEIQKLQAMVSGYVKAPTADGLKKARTAEIDMAALRSLRSQIGDLNVDEAVTAVLDESTEFYPLLADLLAANTTFLEQCNERARSFRIAAAESSEPETLDALRARFYTHQVKEAEQINSKAQRWLQEWSAGQISRPYYNFWAVYLALRDVKTKAYATIADIPLPESVLTAHRERVALKQFPVRSAVSGI